MQGIYTPDFQKKLEGENKMETEAVSNLRRQLKEAEDERRKAAQYGLHILEQQNEMQNQLDELRSELSIKTEKFEQDKYSLQREVELKNRMLESLSFECDALKQQQNMQLDKQREQLERIHGQEISQLKDKLEKLKADLDETRLSEKQLKHKVEHQKAVINAKSEELHMMSERVHETMSSEVLNLQIELTELESVKASVEEKMNELQYSKEQLELANSNLRNQLERLQGDKEEREKEIVSYYNALEKAREANQALQGQLDHALVQALDPTSKGNSLFAEVEDRRAEMERQLISVKVKYQSLQKQHAFTREQLQRMKLQMATLLQMKGSQAELEQLERLQSMLEQKNGEIEDLLMKVRQLEKCKNLYENMKESKPSSSSSIGGEFEDGYYTDLLQMKLENSNKETETLRNELSLQRMKALYESQRVLEVERKLFANERHLQVCQSENMNLRVMLDELKMKYEPEELIKIPKSIKRREKIPVDMTSEPGDSKNATVEKTTHFSSQNKEERKICTKNLDPSDDPQRKYVLVAAPVNITPLPATQQRAEPEKDRKRVKIKENIKGSSERNGNNSLTPVASRSVSSCVYAHGNQRRPASVFFRCMNYAIRFFIYFLSVACSVIPQFRLPTLNFSKPFKKAKMIANENDS
ncbi:protein Spindly isoform X1 [Malaclemys terrapin pileata]|uniref:protein Spindly isoform X1 n=2 Tax=Malaclemys terrapin pileata TaxID=2991368 RepID=UPI0023A8D574|nr:protein Spindly isoform X1 [Malaclemys terrapin pileata]